VPPRTAPVVLVVLTLVFAGFVGLAKPSEASAATPTRAEKVLIRAVNHARAARGIRRLHLGSTIQAGAHGWARYLLARDAFFHGSLRAGTRENIAWLTCRSGWARTIVRMWLNSPVHRDAMLDRSARWSGYRCVRMAVTRFR
jgi:uncharacterized protein YkwD